MTLCGFEGELDRCAVGSRCPEGGMPTAIPVAEVAVILVGMGERLIAVLFCRGAFRRSWHALLVVRSWSKVAARHRAPGGGISSSERNAWARLVHAKVRDSFGSWKTSRFGVVVRNSSLSRMQVRSGDPSVRGPGGSPVRSEGKHSERGWGANLLPV